MAQRAEKFIQVLPQNTGEKVWVEQFSDGNGNNLDAEHITLGIDLVLQDNATLTTTGSQVVYVGANNEVNIIVNVTGTVSGTTPSLTVSVQDVDPGDQVAVLGQAASGAAITATAAKQIISYESNSGYALVKWTITGTTPSFGGTYISTASKTTSLVQPQGGTKSNVAASATSVTVLAANSARKRWMVFNDSSVNLYLDLTGGTASTSSYSVKVAGGQFYEDSQPVVPGLITGIWDSATGNARVTEFV